MKPAVSVGFVVPHGSLLWNFAVGIGRSRDYVLSDYPASQTRESGLGSALQC